MTDRGGPTSGQTTLVYDCFSGISGDMHIGALVDAGVPGDWLRSELQRLPMAGAFELELVPDQRGGIAGTRATVHLRDPQSEHRHLPQIREVVAAAQFEAPVTARIMDIFERLAVAEGSVHGVSPEAVHFHEVGAVDAIVDITAGALGLHWLGVEQAACTVVEVGGGMVHCAHGLMPVPAPATARLLTGLPCHYGRIEAETTTPTGAAILAHAVDTPAVPAAFVAHRVGHGIGQKEFGIPNVLRLLVGEGPAPSVSTDGSARSFTSPAGLEIETNVEIKANIDDMSPEAFTPVSDALFALGARDVHLTPVTMKKGRLAVRLSLLVDEARVDAACRCVLEQTSSVGVRLHRVEKRMLPRRQRTLPTGLGEVRVKLVRRPDGRLTGKPEFDDVERIAARREEPFLQVHGRLCAEIDALLAGRGEDLWD